MAAKNHWRKFVQLFIVILYYLTLTWFFAPALFSLLTNSPPLTVQNAKYKYIMYDYWLCILYLSNLIKCVSILTLTGLGCTLWTHVGRGGVFWEPLSFKVQIHNAITRFWFHERNKENFVTFSHGRMVLFSSKKKYFVLISYVLLG